MTKAGFVQTTRIERRCDNCLRVIPIGDVAYVRHHRRYPATYCMPCYASKRQAWQAPRGETEDMRTVLRLLKQRPYAEEEMVFEVKTKIPTLIRRMVRNGYPVGLLNAATSSNAPPAIVLYRTDFPELLREYLISLFGSRAMLLFGDIFKKIEQDTIGRVR